jgi:hypothetical protein
MVDNPLPVFARSWRRNSRLLVVLLALFLSTAWTQDTQQAPPPTPPSSAPQTPPTPPTAGASVQEQPSQAPAPSQNTAPAESQKPITKAQAKELFRSVDEILQFVSQDTGLPIKHKVKRKLITRRKVERYVEKRMKDDKDTQRLERSQLVLKKFGMIPQDYDLHSELLKLLGEQVAAFYDSKTKTVNLLDWVQPELQKPVLAHELTHALQDQAVDLEKWGMAGAKDDLPLPDQQEQVVEEAQAARQNVTEGQAMVAMLDYTLAPAGVNILTAPDAVNAIRAAMTDGKDSPVLASAPIFLRESLMMPYTFGLDFVREVLSKKGRTAAFDGMLEHPPIDTREVMEPATYLAGQAVEPPTIPDLDKLIAPDYQRYDFGGMGEFDIFLLARQYSPKTDAKKYYTHWRGGYYLAVHAKSAPRDQIALLYFSCWDSPEAAHSFQELYSSYVPTRYRLEPPVGMVGLEGGNDPKMEWNVGAQGKVVLEAHGSDLLIMEGLDDATMERVSHALLPGTVRPQ